MKSGVRKIVCTSYCNIIYNKNREKKFVTVVKLMSGVGVYQFLIPH